MAVYTPVSKAEAQHLLKHYTIGSLQLIEDIAQGIENSNFYLTTDTGRYVLTLFEKRIQPAELPFFMEVMQGFAGQNLPVPRPEQSDNGTPIHQLNGKATCIVNCLPGSDIKSLDDITPAHMAELGVTLAKLHLAGQKLPQLNRANDLSLSGWQQLAENLLPHADSIIPGLNVMLRLELSFLQQHWPQNLTSAIIHADLFIDNILWQGNRISGIIDWYFACRDSCLYDLAIVFNAWCFDGNHRYMPARGDALMQAYRAAGPLPETEWQHFNTICRGAALRFLLTRAYDWLHTPAGVLVTKKDPIEYWLKWKHYAER
ncbi:homoserine kinase [bacterium]|nr:homoserine kinase [bacterium]